MKTMKIKYGIFIVSHFFIAHALAETEISEFSFILKPSPTHGVGVFATHNISKGTKIVFPFLSNKKK